MTTPDLLTFFETCELRGYWAKDWERRRLDTTTLLRRAITAGLIEKDRADYGEVAGEKVMELGEDPGIETPSSHNIYESVIHHAALADMLTQAIRKPDAASWINGPYWKPPVAHWASGAFLEPSGARLRRLALVSSWNDDRHYSEIQSWYTMGEMAMYKLPMRIVVLVLGSQRDGKRSSPWTRGFLHPQNHKLRFRKKSRSTFETFSDKWEHIWREDRGEISNREWLQAMLDDDILRDVCFTVDVPELTPPARQDVLDMATRKLDKLEDLAEAPGRSLSVCQRCQFRGCCWSKEPHEPSEQSGFVNISRRD